MALIRQHSIGAERIEMLEKLNEISLRGFQEMDTTPTTVVTSLPTPQEPLFNMTTQIQSPSDSVIFYMDFPGSLKAPTAPQMKDLDSFTEGTAKGSFDSIAGGSTNEHGDRIPPINSLSLSRLPPQNDFLMAIEIWRFDVFAFFDEAPDTPAPNTAVLVITPVCKRPRSTATDEEEEERRIRIRSRTSSSPAVSTMGMAVDCQFTYGPIPSYPAIEKRPAPVPPRPYSAPPR